jgi:phenylacetate-CoA ligase
MSRSELYFRRITLLAVLGHYLPLRFPLRIADVGPMVPHRKRSVAQRLGFVTILRVPGDAPLSDQREALLGFGPTILEGYPTCLELLAGTLSDSEARRLRPLVVASRGECLREDTRDLLEHTFRARVANLYNCEEVGSLAWECPDRLGRLHVNSDTCVVEVTDGNGEPTDGQGDVVVTNLYNRTMPFVRYRLGDRATLCHAETACSCGASGSWLEKLGGREEDHVSCLDGQSISPWVLTSTLYNALRSPGDPHRLGPSVRRYQIVQEEDHSLRVLLDWQGPPDADLVRRITSGMEQASHGLRCEVEATSTFELTPAGKFKVVLSRVPTNSMRRPSS